MSQAFFIHFAEHPVPLACYATDFIEALTYDVHAHVANVDDPKVAQLHADAEVFDPRTEVNLVLHEAAVCVYAPHCANTSASKHLGEQDLRVQKCKHVGKPWGARGCYESSMHGKFMCKLTHLCNLCNRQTR